MFIQYHSNYLDRTFTFETCMFSDLLKKYKIDGIEDACGLTFIDESTVIHIWMPSFDKANTEDIATLSHEITHAAAFGLDIAQIPLYQRMQDGPINTEALAYLVGELTEAFLSKVPEKTNMWKRKKTKR